MATLSRLFVPHVGLIQKGRKTIDTHLSGSFPCNRGGEENVPGVSKIKSGEKGREVSAHVSEVRERPGGRCCGIQELLCWSLEGVPCPTVWNRGWEQATRLGG